MHKVIKSLRATVICCGAKWLCFPFFPYFPTHTHTNTPSDLISFHPAEKHYGCYKAGIFFALAIILLLLAGCLPVFLLTTNNNLILLILLVTLLAIGLATFVYLRWQRNRALAMRRTYEQQKFTLTRVHHSSGAGNGATTPTTAVTAAVVPDTPKDNGMGTGIITTSTPIALYGQVCMCVCVLGVFLCGQRAPLNEWG